MADKHFTKFYLPPLVSPLRKGLGTGERKAKERRSRQKRKERTKLYKFSLWLLNKINFKIALNLDFIQFLSS